MTRTGAPATAAGSSDFDFWLGDWNATWAEGGQGTNRVDRILGGKVILEQFSSPALNGSSFTVHRPERNEWLQTWVDQNGAYIVFKGGRRGDRMILEGGRPGDDLSLLRMVWESITPDAFVWDCLRSTDGGRTWSPFWRIDYRRRGG